MKLRQQLRRLFKSQWTQIFGPALIVLESLAVAAAAATGDWTLAWAFPLLLAFFFLRALIIAVLLLSPILVAVIVVWAVYTHSKEKEQKKANLQASKGRRTTSSDSPQ